MAIKKGAIEFDTRINSDKITKEFKNLEKSTQSLINKYNHSVDSIKNQELAITKVKDKISEINSGSVVPKSIVNLEKELTKSNKDLTTMKNNLSSLGDKIEFAPKDKVNQLSIQYTQLEEEIYNTQTRSEQLKKKLEQLKLNPNLTSEAKELNGKLAVMESKLSQTKDEANQTAKAIKKAFDNKNKVVDFGDEFKNVGNKIEKLGSRITKTMISIAIFDVFRDGLRSLRDGFVSVLKTNDTFNNSLNQIKANLMTAFVPVYNAILPAINRLMNALAKLSGTLAIFISGLFGKSISDSSKEANKLSKSLKGVEKSSKKASGSLASFDKLEILQDSGATGTSSNPQNDYNSEIQYSQTLLDFLNRIKSFIDQNGEYIISFIGGITASLLLLKLGLSGIMSLGIGVSIAGLIFLIQSVIAYMNDPSWENFGKIIQGISVIVIGLGIAFGGLPVALAGAVALMVGLLVSNWEKIKSLGLTAVSWIDSHIDEIGKNFGIVGQFIAGIIQGTILTGIDLFEDLFGGAKRVVDGIIKIFKGDFKNGIKDVFDGLKSIIISPLNLIRNGVNTLIGGFNKIKWDVPDWVPKIGGKRLGFNIPKIPKLAKGDVIPPRHEYLAVLGDQKHGTNVEAPLETIKQANREVFLEFLDVFKNMPSNEKEIILKNLTFIFNLGNKSFQKMVIDSVRLTENEIGKPLFVN